MIARRFRAFVPALLAAFVGVLALVLGACEIASHLGDFATVSEAGTGTTVVYIEGGTTIIEGGTTIVYADAAFSCPTGQTECNEDGGVVCHDLTDDLQNCGACGNACAARRTCTNGACECVAGTKLCKEVCTVLESDPSNCGSCGNVCGTDSICAAGTCVPDCQQGQTTCSKACVDLQTSKTNCGLCGNACGGVCVSGACCTSNCVCPPGQAMCSGACTDLTSSAANCGKCGAVCGASQSCIASQCTCAAGLTLCGGSCLSCPSGAVCTSSGGSGGSCSCPTGEVNGACCVNGTTEKNGVCCVATDTAKLQSDGSYECCTKAGALGTHCCPSGQTYCAAAGSCQAVGDACLTK